ncbi:BnaC04g08240D [Brassica napus]|uniref:BnaC04g08240D protein n=1 Tax=Brassica napus TaxID=3708 RepID=A0A078H3J7_BRANA|nr:BnaC04g08240D [Brassica napus]
MESVAIPEHLIKLLPVAEPGIFDLVGYVISAVEGNPYQSVFYNGNIVVVKQCKIGMDVLIYPAVLKTGHDYYFDNVRYCVVVRRLKKPVYWLDITGLSQLRKDAHLSSYSGNHPGNDSHWCLPGVPDTWNILFYSALFS